MSQPSNDVEVNNSLDFLHKSKKPLGFLGETKPSTTAYIDDCYGAEASFDDKITN
ncbi:MAG: hypothetical protein LN561_05155 [Rickettsia endosymbiont of Labidopullus appendiculatus]|nr:hypothetical protein [Rickettsia endosymbiont of Labidopullus appendiculatus]